MTVNNIDIAHYLIVTKKASVTDPYFYYGFADKDTILNIDEPHYPVDLLYNWVYDLDSENHRKKMEIVEEFKRQGIDYFSPTRKIFEGNINKIKQLHPDDWEEYLKRY